MKLLKVYLSVMLLSLAVIGTGTLAHRYGGWYYFLFILVVIIYSFVYVKAME